MLRNNKTKNIIYFIFLGVLLSGLYHFLVAQKAVVEATIDTEARTIFKIYWAERGELFSERHMVQVLILPDQKEYTFRLCNLKGVERLRIDTAERIANVTIGKMRIKQQGYPELSYETIEDLSQFEVIEGIGEITVDEDGLHILPANNDPQLLLKMPALVSKSIFGSELVRFVCIILLCISLYFLLPDIQDKYHYVNYLIVLVFVLIAVMASISKHNKHPDEYVHVAAAKYYQDHNLPPRIGSPDILHTYSPYGVSRLHSGEIVYFFAGKFLKLFKPFHLDTYLLLRFFNVMLFGILLILSLKRDDFAVFMLPVLISPQIWYIFSYFNSDAFAFFVCMIAGYQLANSDSMLHKYVQERVNGKALPYLLAVGSILALLLFLKKNFYFFYVFAFLYFIWKIVFQKFPVKKENIKRIGAILLVGFSLFGIFTITDQAVNGFDKKQKLLEAREKYADHLFKPSTPLNEKHIYLQMKERGKTLKNFLLLDRWGEKSFRTSFGVYGFTSIPAPFIYYDFVRIVGLLLLFVVVISVVAKGGASGNSLLAITLFSAIALIVVATYHAWTVDFQAQGRYFLPIIAMLSVLLYHTERYYPRFVFHTLFWGMLLLSLYNFLFVGLHDIAKYGAC